MKKFLLVGVLLINILNAELIDKRAIVDLYKKFEVLEKKCSSKTYASIQINSKKYFVNTWKLNIRHYPDTRLGKIISVKNIGDVIRIKRSINNSWFITEEGFFVKKEYLNIVENLELEAIKDLKLRDIPYIKENGYLEIVSKGHKLKGMGFINQWYVLDDGTFVLSKYLK